MKQRAQNVQLPLVDTPAGRNPTLRPVVSGATPQSSSAHRAARRNAWLSLRFTDLPLVAATREVTSQHTAIAVVDDDRQRRVIACNDFAMRSGIRAGHTFNAAIAINADVHLVNRDLERERELLHELAMLCHQYSPTVAVASDCELLVEVKASLRMFGGVNALVNRVRDDLSRLGWHPQGTLSPTAWSALWTARTVISRGIRVVTPRELPRTLGEVPIAVLDWPFPLTQRVRRFGVSRVGELLRLPRDGLAKRIGVEFLQQLDQARGRVPSVHRTVQPPLVYADHMHLDFEVETSGLLERLLEPRLDKLQRFLRKRARAVREIQVRLEHRERSATILTIALASPTSDVNRMRRILSEKLASRPLDAPVRHVCVIAQRFEAQVSDSESLLPSSQPTRCVAEAKAELLELLETRLGPGSIRQPRHRADRRPENAAGSDRATPGAPVPTVGVPSENAARPIWLLKTPARWRRSSGSYLIERGPERIRAGWWDGEPVDRDYYAVRSRDGQSLWIFHDNTKPGSWYVHGLFA